MIVDHTDLKYCHAQFYIIYCLLIVITEFSALAYLSPHRNSNTPDAENPDGDAPNLQVFSFSKIREATNNFSDENKLGKGGFGIVYKVMICFSTKMSTTLQKSTRRIR